MKWRKPLAVLLGGVLLAALCLPAAAAEKPPKQMLRVGYWPGYGITQEANGKVSGYAYDYIGKIAQINGWSVKYIPCDWAEGMEKLTKGEIDLFGPLQKTPEREKVFDYPDYHMGYEYGALYVKSENESIFYNDFESINGKTVGTVTQNFYNEPLNKFCAEKGIAVQIKTIDNAEELDRAFQNGELDLFAASSMQPPPNTKMVMRFSSQEFYYPTTRSNTAVLEGLNFALREIQRDNLYYDAELYNKYYAKIASNGNAFTAEEQEFIRSAPPIKVGYDVNWSPIEYYDKAKGEPKGITIDILESISEYSGLKFQYTRTEDFEQALGLAVAGQADIVSGLASNSGVAKTYQLMLTEPFLRSKLAFIVRQGTQIEENQTHLALPKDWISIRYQMMENYPNLGIILYDTEQDCLDAVLTGKADMTVQNTLAADRALKPYRYRSLSINNMRGGDLSVCFGVAKGQPPELASILNKSILALSDDEVNQMIYTHTIGVPYELSFSDSIRYNSPILVAVLILFFCVLYILSLRTRKKLNKIAYYDPLTGEMNLNKFKIEAQKVMNRTQEDHVIVVIDINKFKSVNDMYGYDFGDKVLIFVAKALRDSLVPGGLLCRGTADKFYFFFKDRGESWLSGLFYSFAKRVENISLSDKVVCKIVLNGGVCVVHPKETNIISLIDRANIASKQVKKCHTSSFVYYDQSMYDKINRAKRIENNMSEALANHEFVVYLQPKVQLSNWKMVAAEALVRWDFPGKVLMQPGDFIPLFEENGFVVDLDYYVFEEVCRLLERWKREKRPMFIISVNLSRRHLENRNTARLLYDIVSRYDMNAEMIEIELTESAFVDCDVQAILDLLEELHNYGFTVSVDDFGAGYSSLSLLKDLPIDVLKIDKSFFDTAQNAKAELLLETVITLSRKMNIKTVSEGVETKKQVDLLAKLGCDLVQGFYFARPMPVGQLERILDEEEEQAVGAIYNENNHFRNNTAAEETGDEYNANTK